jgi:hypothetical protein
MKKIELSHGLKPLSLLEDFPFTLPIIRDLTNITRLIGWRTIDIFRAIKNRGKKIHLYGIWCFVGLPGAGKTMSLVRYLDQQRRKYGNKVIIFTNFRYAGEDGAITGWQMLKQEYDRPVIFAWDELQNEFNSRKYRDFPIPLIHELTQNRKGNGKQIVFTTQEYTAVDKTFRNLTTQVVDCRTYLGRMTSCRYFDTKFFEAMQAAAAIERKIKIRPKRVERYIQTDDLRKRYDSFQRLDYLKGLDFNGINESQKAARS